METVTRRTGMKKKWIVYAGVASFLFAGISATNIPSPADEEFKNLKVMPRNTNGEHMDQWMYKMGRALGVSCIYCHPFTKPNVVPQRVDFVTDEVPEKAIARKMMIMTDKLNKKYFGFTNQYDLESLNSKKGISCNTCHNGQMKP
jgi:hypothetical protein